MPQIRFVALLTLVLSVLADAQDKPRVFMAGRGTTNAMTHGGVGGTHSGGGWWAAGRTDSIVDAHDESMELVKDFAHNCPGVQVTVKEDAADYITALNRESKAKKGIFSKNDQIMVSNKAGDVLLSSTVRSVATAAKDACNVIMADFAAHGHAHAAGTVKPAPALLNASGSPGDSLQSAAAIQNPPTVLDIISTPDGAEIDIDGRFVGNTPSTISLAPGDHTVTLRLAGCQSWQRAINTTGGKVKLTAVLPKLDGSTAGQTPVVAPTSLGDAARAVRTQRSQPKQSDSPGTAPR